MPNIVRLLSMHFHKILLYELKYICVDKFNKIDLEIGKMNTKNYEHFKLLYKSLNFFSSGWSLFTMTVVHQSMRIRRVCSDRMYLPEMRKPR